MAALSASAYINKVSEHKDARISARKKLYWDTLYFKCRCCSIDHLPPHYVFSIVSHRKNLARLDPMSGISAPAYPPTPLAQNQHRDFPGGNTAMLSAPFVLSYRDICHIFYSQSICYSSSF